MEAYTSFAQVYDLFMDNVPYREWSEYIIEKLRELGVNAGCVADIGCGTGKLTQLLSDAGYDMIGIDSSMEMLDIAMQQENENILYLMQDMRTFETGESVSAVISACDSVNYILEEEDLCKVFERVYSNLEDNGVFIFDMNTPYKYEKLLADNTFAETRDEGSFIWENYYDEKEKINEYYLTLFICEDEQGQLYRKFEEIHYQRCYELDVIKKLLAQNGLQLIAVYDAYTDKKPSKDSDRVIFIAKKC